MALVFMDGFDHYNIADIGKKWTYGTSATGTASMVSGRIGGQALQLDATNFQPSFSKAFPTALVSGATGGVGFALKMTSWTNPSDRRILNAYSGTSTQYLSLMVNLDLTLSLYYWNNTFGLTACGTGGQLQLNNWAFIEWKWLVHNTAGTMNLRLNGVDVITVTGTDTYPGGDISSIILGGNGGFTRAQTYIVDDLYMFDGSAGVTDFLGDVTVQTRLVTANGTTNQGVASTGSNYACVDEALANTSDYVTLDAANEIETYVVEDVAAGASIKGVQVTALSKKSTDGGATIVSEVRHSGSNYDHPTAQGLNTDYEFKTFIHETDPLSATWTDSTFNAAEFGVKKVS